jgi:hypothetical protein
MTRAPAALALMILIGTASIGLTAAIAPQPNAISVTGPPVSGLQAFDTFRTSLMAQWGVPGAALAVA